MSGLADVLLFLIKATLAVCTLGVYPIILPGIPNLMNRMKVESQIKEQMRRDAIRYEARRRRSGW